MKDLWLSSTLDVIDDLWDRSSQCHPLWSGNDMLCRPLRGTSGKFYSDCKEVNASTWVSLAGDAEAARKLWDVSLKLTASSVTLRGSNRRQFCDAVCSGFPATFPHSTEGPTTERISISCDHPDGGTCRS